MKGSRLNRFPSNSRVMDGAGNRGRLLRYEKYPYVGICATVKWDHKMFPSRVAPEDLQLESQS